MREEDIENSNDITIIGELTAIKKELYKMELHEYKSFKIKNLPSGAIGVIRVPGGWIYKISNDTNIFVPYSGEFRERKAYVS